MYQCCFWCGDHSSNKSIRNWSLDTPFDGTPDFWVLSLLSGSSCNILFLPKGFLSSQGPVHVNLVFPPCCLCCMAACEWAPVSGQDCLQTSDLCSVGHCGVREGKRPALALLWKCVICLSDHLSWVSQTCSLQRMYSFSFSDTIVALVFLLSSQNFLVLQVPLRHLVFVSAQNRGTIVYIIEHVERLFPALILSGESEHSTIVMAFARMGNTCSVFILFLEFVSMGIDDLPRRTVDQVLTCSKEEIWFSIMWLASS